MRFAALLALGLIERALDRFEAAQARVELRSFLRDHPEVHIYFPDGGYDHSITRDNRR